MEYEPKTWGSYVWDENLSFSENVQAAQAANALIQASDLQRLENALRDLGVALENIELTPGTPGDRGDKGDKGDKGDPGDDGADGLSVTAIALETDDNGAVIGGLATLSDNSTITIDII